MTNDHIGCKKNNATLLKKTGSIKINSFKKLQKYIISKYLALVVLIKQNDKKCYNFNFIKKRKKKLFSSVLKIISF